MRRFAGHLTRRSAGGTELTLRSITLSIVLLARTVARCELQADNRRLPSYKVQPKLLLVVSSVLEFNRKVQTVLWVLMGTNCRNLFLKHLQHKTILILDV